MKSDSKGTGDGLMDMMKNMYQDGDDETKKAISQAWTKSQEQKKGGMGMGGFGMPDLSNM